MKIYNWGIIGPGKIAHRFAEDLALLPNARLHAVASRSEERARAFADQYAAAHAYGGYEQLFRTPDLDVVYVATPHIGHYENTLRCLHHHVPVLCEKPFSMHALQTREMIAAARAHQTFVMEAIWTRFLPHFRKTVELVEAGVIGELLSIKADFGFRAKFDPQGRLFNAALGGGALLDIGLYPVFLALHFLGKPTNIQAVARLGHTGVDEETGMLFRYDDGRLAHLHATLTSTTSTEAYLYGTLGTIHLHSRWHEPTEVSLHPNAGTPQIFRFEEPGNGYQYEAEEVMRCLDRSQTESRLLPLDCTLLLTETLDTIRKQIGLDYPETD